MHRRRSAVVAAIVLGGVAPLGCFPSFTFGDGTEGGAPADGGVDATISDAAGDANDANDARGIEGGESDGPAGDGPAIDSALPDGSGLPVVGCSMGGAQPGAAWPMQGYCPEHRYRSPFDGPHAPPTLRWKVVTPEAISCGPVVDANGTLYVPTAAGRLHALDGDDGGARWTFAPADAGIMASAPGIAADGTIFVGDLSGNLYAVAPDGGLAAPTRSLPSPTRSGPTIGPNGTLFFSDTQSGVFGLTPAGVTVFYVDAPVGSFDESTPAVGSDGTVYVESDHTSVVALRPDGGALWSNTFAPNTSLAGPMVTPDGMVVVTYETLIAAVRASDGGTLWTINASSSDELEPPASADDGTLYYSSNVSGPVHVQEDGGALDNPGLVECTTPVIDASGWVFAACPYKDESQIIGMRGGAVQWTLPFADDQGQAVNDSLVIGRDGTLYFTVHGDSETDEADGGSVVLDAVYAVR